MKITKKQEQLLSYALIAIIVISLANFGISMTKKSKQAKIDSINELINKEEQKNANLIASYNTLESENNEIISETEKIGVSEDGSGEFGKVEYMYTDEYLTSFKNNLSKLKKDKTLFTALPLEDQLYSVIYTRNSDTSMDSMLTAERKGFGPDYTYTITDHSQDNMATLSKTNNLHESLDIFLFGPFGLVLDYNKETKLLNDSIEISRRDIQHSGLGSIEFNLSYFRLSN